LGRITQVQDEVYLSFKANELWHYDQIIRYGPWAQKAPQALTTEPFVITEWCPNTLEKVLSRSTFTWYQAVAVLRDISAAMKTLHNIDWVYRNFTAKGIHPSFIHSFIYLLLLDIGIFFDNEKPRAVLLDFAYACPADAKYQLKTDLEVHLAEPFNPPECRFYTREKKFNTASDVFNFGQLLLYVCCHFTGFSRSVLTQMWQNQDVDSLPLSFSKEIKDLLRSCLHHDPALRGTATRMFQCELTPYYTLHTCT
jgi:serine/threonine protein kinase